MAMIRQHEGERSKLYWVPPLVFVGGLLLSVMALTYIIEDQFHTAGFITAAIMASIGFHLFSLGNTAYACAASLENEELTEYGYYINQNGIYATFGAGGVFLASVLWFLLQEINKPEEFFWYLYWSNISGWTIESIEELHFIVLRSGIIIGVLVFSAGFLNQSKFGNWFTVILEEINTSSDYTTIVDEILDKISSLFGRSMIHDLTEHTITIKEVDISKFHVIEVEAPDEVDPGETYTIQATIGNRGSIEGTCKVVYQWDGEIVDSVEKTLSGGSEATVEFSDRAPESPGECTIGIGFEEVD